MKKIGFTIAVALSCATLLGCTDTLIGAVAEALLRVPFVDRTEKEVNDWFDNRTIVDDKPFTSNAAVNGEPSVLLIPSGTNLTVNGRRYPGALCITQTNSLPRGQTLKYAALVGINVLDDANLFECGEVEVGTKSCDGDPMAVNVSAFHTSAQLATAFRQAVNEWLLNDIVATLRSSTNTDGLADPSTAQPREAATTRGVMYSAREAAGPPVVRTIGFIAE